MNIVKEYIDDKTKIRIHNDYIRKDDKEVKEMIISLVVNYMKKINALL